MGPVQRLPEARPAGPGTVQWTRHLWDVLFVLVFMIIIREDDAHDSEEQFIKTFEQNSEDAGKCCVRILDSCRGLSVNCSTELQNLPFVLNTE